MSRFWNDRRTFIKMSGTLFALFVAGNGFAQTGTTEEVSGRELREAIEERVDKYISRLERTENREISASDRKKIVDSLFGVAKTELERGQSYVVIDP